MTDTTAPQAQDLHAQIMNLSPDAGRLPAFKDMRIAYLSGHRDARHAAAELAAAALAQRDARIAELEALAERLNAALQDIGDCAHDRSTGPAIPDDLWEIRRMAYDNMEPVGAALAAAPAAAPLNIAQMARSCGLLHGPADDDRARLTLAALGLFAKTVLAAAPAAAPRQPLTDDDVFTLIGHAVGLRADGRTDMPRYFMDLAERIALARGDEEAAKRVRDLVRQHGIGAPAPATGEQSK